MSFLAWTTRVLIPTFVALSHSVRHSDQCYKTFLGRNLEYINFSPKAKPQNEAIKILRVYFCLKNYIVLQFCADSDIKPMLFEYPNIEDILQKSFVTLTPEKESYEKILSLWNTPPSIHPFPCLLQIFSSGRFKKPFFSLRHSRDDLYLFPRRFDWALFNKDQCDEIGRFFIYFLATYAITKAAKIFGDFWKWPLCQLSLNHCPKVGTERCLESPIK